MNWLPDLDTVTWAGVGAILAGLGSLFTGIAALRRSKQEGRKEAGRES